jgi:hypothetical protein
MYYKSILLAPYREFSIGGGTPVCTGQFFDIMVVCPSGSRNSTKIIISMRMGIYSIIMYALPLTLFLLSMLQKPVQVLVIPFVPRQRNKEEPLAVAAVAITSSADFDFSSQYGWENYYRESNKTVEWHSSVNLTRIVNAFVPRGRSCIILGCGNAPALPRLLLSHVAAKNVVCIDSSQTSLNLLKSNLKGFGLDKIEYICGDAITLSSTLGKAGKVDVILDKGLMDAILCGEGWNTPIQKLLHESQQILSDKGFYLLISYLLPPSTQDFIQLSCPGLKWTFCLAEGNDRVQLSVGKKLRALE